MLSSDVILDDINRCLLTPLTLSLSLHSLICTPCSTSNPEYEKKIMTMHSRSCSSQLCNIEIHPQNYPILHMSDDDANQQREFRSSSDLSQSLRKSTFQKTNFPYNLYSFVASEINSLNNPTYRSTRRLACFTDPSNVSMTSEEEMISLYLIFIRRSFYAAQVFR